MGEIMQYYLHEDRTKGERFIWCWVDILYKEQAMLSTGHAVTNPGC